MESELPMVKTKKSLIPPGLQIAEDDAGLLFFSRETDDMFVLSALLKGYKKERITVSKSKTKPQVLISGDKPVQEKGLRWTVPKKIERTGFRKIFWIPDGVNKLRVKFNEKENILAIFMTKSVAGIQGAVIKEVKEGVAEGETSEEIIKMNPVVTAKAAQTFEPKLKQPEISKSQDVLGETISELPESKGNKTSETTTTTDSIKAPAKTVTDHKAEANELIKPHPKEMQQQQPSELPEHVTGKISTQVPARTAAEPERKVTEPMKARPEEIQHEKPSVLHADIVQQDSNQVSADITADSDLQTTDPMKAHLGEIQHEQALELPEDIAEAELTQAPANTTTNPEGIELMKVNEQKIQREQPSTLPEVITAGDSTRVSANTTMNPEIEAKQQMKSHSDEIQKEPAAPEDNTEADSTNGPAKTTTYPERGVIEPMKAHSKEILHEQPSAVPEDISTVDSTQIPAIEPKKDHAEEIQHEPPFALTEDISKEENIIQEQEVKEPWNDELDQAVQPINEMHNEVLQRDEYTDEKEAEITVPAEQSQKQNETLKDGSTSKELQSEDQMKDEQTEDQELQREEIHGKQPDIQEEQQLDAVNVPEEDAEPQKEKENDKDGKSLLCNSCIFAGSAVMGIIIVFVIQLMRRSNNSKK